MSGDHHVWSGMYAVDKMEGATGRAVEQRGTEGVLGFVLGVPY
jgi:hypothetical protein